MEALGWIAFLSFGLLVAAGSYLVKRSRVTKLPHITEEEFLKGFPVDLRREASKEILMSRRNVAQELGVPEDKVCPRMEFGETARLLDLSVGMLLANSDLLEDLEDEMRLAKIDFDAKALGNEAKTIGSYVELFVRASIAKRTR